jgi:hypothetical protein
LFELNNPIESSARRVFAVVVVLNVPGPECASPLSLFKILALLIQFPPELLAGSRDDVLLLPIGIDVAHAKTLPYDLMLSPNPSPGSLLLRFFISL